MLLSTVYDGHARNVAHLPLDVFVAFTVASATELPADLFLILVLDRWGRRWLAFGTLVLSGFFSILTLAFSGAFSAGLDGDERARGGMLGRLCVFGIRCCLSSSLSCSSPVLSQVVHLCVEPMKTRQASYTYFSIIQETLSALLWVIFYWFYSSPSQTNKQN